MKKKIFDKGLFAEAFRQTKVIGIVGAAVSVGLSLFISFISFSDSVFSFGTESHTNLVQSSAPTVVDYSLTFLFSFLVWALVVPLMTLYLFRYENKRFESDFYHTLPQTRQCIYVSFASVIAAWCVSITVVGTALNVFLMKILEKNIVINYYDIILGALGDIVITLLVLSAILLGISLTGTVFHNMLASAIILFVPRLIMTMITTAVADSLTMLSDVPCLTVCNKGYNIFTDKVFVSIESLVLENKAGVEVKGIIYTLVIAVIYFMLGMFFSTRRKSEIAGGAGNRGVRLFLRFGLLLPVTVFAMTEFLFDAVGTSFALSMNDVGDDFDYYFQSIVGEIIGTVVAFAVVIIVFFVIEIIASKKFKSIVKVLPAAAVFLGINVLLFGGMLGARALELAMIPTSSQMESVAVSKYSNQDFYDFLSPYTGSDDNYFERKKENVRITDKTVKKVIALSLKRDVEYNEKWSMFVEGAGNYYDESVQNPDNISMTYSVNVKSGVFDYDYKVDVRDTDEIKYCSILMKSLAENEDYAGVYSNLPVDVYVYSDGGYLTDEAAKEVYSEACGEILWLSNEELISYFENDKNSALSRCILNVMCFEGGEPLEFTVVINDKTPDAENLLWEKAAEVNNEGRAKVDEVLSKDADSAFEGDFTSISFDFYRANSGMPESEKYYVDALSVWKNFSTGTWDEEKFRTKTFSLLKDYYDSAVPQDDYMGEKDYLCVNINTYYGYYEALYPLPSDYAESEAFKTLLQNADPLVLPDLAA